MLYVRGAERNVVLVQVLKSNVEAKGEGAFVSNLGTSPSAKNSSCARTNCLSYNSHLSKAFRTAKLATFSHCARLRGPVDVATPSRSLSGIAPLLA